MLCQIRRADIIVVRFYLAIFKAVITVRCSNISLHHPLY